MGHFQARSPFKFGNFESINMVLGHSTIDVLPINNHSHSQGHVIYYQTLANNVVGEKGMSTVHANRVHSGYSTENSETLHNSLPPFSFPSTLFSFQLCTNLDVLKDVVLNTSNTYT